MMVRRFPTADMLVKARLQAPFPNRPAPSPARPPGPPRAGLIVASMRGADAPVQEAKRGLFGRLFGNTRGGPRLVDIARDMEHRPPFSIRLKMLAEHLDESGLAPRVMLAVVLTIAVVLSISRLAMMTGRYW